jgi:predicted Zn-dependent peptidase
MRSVLGAAALLLAGLPLAAQERIAVFPESGTTVVAAEILVAAGSLFEPEDRAGIGYLSARTIVRPIRPALDSLGVSVHVSSHKDAIGISVVAPPDVWEEATRLILVALFRDPADSRAFLVEREAIRRELVGREASPADALRRTADSVFFGLRHPYGRPSVGTAATLGGLELEDVDDFLRAEITPGRAVIAVVGPVDPASARSHLRPYIQSPRDLERRYRAPRPLLSPTRRAYNSITTWLVAIYPLEPDADLEAVRLLGTLAGESLSFGPLRRSVYNVHAEVIPRIGGGELRLQVVVPPGEADRWMGEVRNAVERFARSDPEPAEFEAQLRRHRGSRLLELAYPETRAAQAARRLLISGEIAPAQPELEPLTPQRLRAAARSLGIPSVVYLGPLVRSGD